MTPKRRETSVDDVKAFWSSHVNNEYYTDASRGSETYFDEIEQRRYRWHYHLVRLFESLRGSHGRLLEIGCGIGVDSIQLAKCGFDVTAVDLTSEAIEIAKTFAARRDVSIDFRVANAEGLDFPDESFDVVYSFGVLHHTPHIDQAVREVRRVLKPGGTALIMLYAKYSLVNAIHRAFRLPYESRDGNDSPVNYTFSERGVEHLFADFSRVSVTKDYPFTFGFGPLPTKLPTSLQRTLGHAIGWHMMIEAMK